MAKVGLFTPTCIHFFLNISLWVRFFCLSPIFVFVNLTHIQVLPWTFSLANHPWFFVRHIASTPMFFIALITIWVIVYCLFILLECVLPESRNHVLFLSLLSPQHLAQCLTLILGILKYIWDEWWNSYLQEN